MTKDDLKVLKEKVDLADEETERTSLALKADPKNLDLEIADRIAGKKYARARIALDEAIDKYAEE